MHVNIAVLTPMVLAFGTACIRGDPDEVAPGLTTAEVAADLCKPTTGTGQFRDRGIPISSGRGQGRACTKGKAQLKAIYNFATRNCRGDFDPGCPADCDECSEEEPCQTVVGMDDQVVDIPTGEDDGMTCVEVEDRSCPANDAGRRIGFRCTLDAAKADGTSHTYYCNCFCRP